MAVLFDGDDAAYQAWLTAYPCGYVLNVRRSLAPSYMVLHRAACSSISGYTRMAQAGGFTERNYLKLCANDLEHLRAWVRRHGRADGSFSKRCGRCCPETRNLR